MCCTSSGYSSSECWDLDKGQKVTIEANVGFPQGSVLGPECSKILFDDCLSLPLPEGCVLMTCIDDEYLLVGGNSRKEVESKAEECLEMVLELGKRN